MRTGLIMALILMAGLTQAATINVGPGQSIQAAIDAAAAGDVIEVAKGTYQENINITKQLTIRAVNVGRKGIDIPVLNGGNKGDVATVFADGVVLEGFAVTNGFNGIAVKSNGNLLEGNFANYNQGFGIIVFSQSQNRLVNNTAIQNGKAGIGLFGADNSTVVGSKVMKNSLGILVTEGSSGNVLSMNSLMQNQENAYDDGTNQWDDGSKGNYYDNNACSDAKADGICDVQFKIPGGPSIDRYPLARSAA